MNKTASFFLASIIFAEIILFSGCSVGKGNNLKILSADGTELALLDSISDNFYQSDGNDRRAYIQSVLSESEEIIVDLLACTQEKARDYLIKNGCVIYTAFDEKVFESVKSSYEAKGINSLKFGCAVTDLHGGILALYSAGNNEEGYVNYATEQTPPYSSFKPLCVYAPAIDKGLATWSSVYPDSPIKKITEENKQVDWPSNATGIYANKNIDIAYAIKTSLNTVAVRCMQTLGVNNSLDFFERSFGLTLEFEKKKAEAYGEDEVIGNVALGYLNDGASPADMAGYYQIFANGGYYFKPHTVLKICDKNGNTLYKDGTKPTRIIKSSTAFIMNRLLQNVVSAGGTGEKARCEGVCVGGKTGTGDHGNWFVGFTPQYTCAVWHGTELVSNNSCEIFSKAVSGFENKTGMDFPSCDEIEKAAYCRESGMLLGEKCKEVDMGYFASGNLPEVCDKHS